MNLSDIARKIMEADDDKYVSIGYGRYKLKGKEDDDNADVFTKTDSGQYVKSADQKSDDDKGGEEKPSGGGMGAGDFERDFDDDEPKGKKDAQGREYDPMTGKGKGLDYRGEPDDEEWFKSMMGGGEPDDKPFGGDSGTDADFQGEPPEGAREPDDVDDDEPEGGGAKSISDDEFEKLNTFGDYSYKTTDSPSDVEADYKMGDVRSAIVSDISKKADVPEDDFITIANGYDEEDYETLGDYYDDLMKGAKELKGELGGKDESIIINGKKYRPIKESILNENPAAMAAAAMATVKVKNAQGKQIKGTSALQSSDPSVQKKAKSIFQRLKDKFSKKKGKKDFEKQKKKVAKGADAWVKKQSKSDADFYKRQFTGESIIIDGKKYRPIKESNQRIFKENYDKIFRSLK